MAPQRCKDRGFTALELMVALTVAAVLLALAAPGFSQLRRSAGVSSSANQMLGALHYARSSAILRNLPTVLCLTADGNRCLTTTGTAASGWIVFHDQTRSAPIQVNGADQVLLEFALPRDLTLSGSRVAVTYWPTPRAGTTSTFKLCDAHSARPGRSVIVSQTGRPRVAGEVSCAP